MKLVTTQELNNYIIKENGIVKPNPLSSDIIYINQYTNQIIAKKIISQGYPPYQCYIFGENNATK